MHFLAKPPANFLKKSEEVKAQPAAKQPVEGGIAFYSMSTKPVMDSFKVTYHPSPLAFVRGETA